ncbi:MAG: CHAT domain-containing protein, partial [Thiothrix litoralis]|uniref:CHAT domain-containing protein n=1 Tax=Thiothrix litoralis TaxID=2891210 RepID=UPI003C72D888
MEMKHAFLTLFRKDDRSFELRVSNDGKAWDTFPLQQVAVEPLLALLADQDPQKLPTLQQQGEILFQWINQHTQHWLRTLRQRPRPRPLVLHIHLQTGDLRHLPWELLHDGSHFLCASPPLFALVRRCNDEDENGWETQPRQLGILLMASSPEDVTPVLDFEAEEAAILQATSSLDEDINHRINLQVEESGSLQGLIERLKDMRQAPDILHLSGHADILNNQQPVFLLENEVGERTDATPDELAEVLLEANRYPPLVFLSGCRTGESRHQHNILSFSEQLVNAGVPVVLGWALPVGDVAASQAAALLYGKLAEGWDIPRAIAYTRQQLYQLNNRYWHLLRCYTDASPLTPLVDTGELEMREYQAAPAFLELRGVEGADPKLRVCPRSEFVGRRRLLQRCLRHLRAKSGTHYAEGVLLQGMGGLGKSSVAVRLVDRLHPSFTPVIHYGGLDESSLLNALLKTEALANKDVRALLRDTEQTLHERLVALLKPQSPYRPDKKPLLLVLDDFEQNIPEAVRKQGKDNFAQDYTPESLRVLNTLLQAIRASRSASRVIITSRFAVPVSEPCRLHSEHLPTLLGNDLKKKLAQLPQLKTAQSHVISDNNTQALRLTAIELAGGNPRLLEWMNDALNAVGLDTPALFAKLQATATEFRVDVLIEALVEAQASPVRHALACAALYRLPVALAAIEALNDDPHTAQHLQTAAKVGLVEIVPTNHGTTHFVSPLLETVLAEELSDADRQPLAAKASQHLFEVMPDNRSEEWSQEIVRLAVLGQEQSIAVEVGDKLAANMQRNNRYREAEKLCQLVLTLGEEFRILTTLARAEQSLGRSETRQHFERAVALLPDSDEGLEDAVLREKSATLFNYGNLLIRQGQIDTALTLYQEKVIPLLEKLGDVRSKAVTMGKIADILQARGQLDEALHIRQTEQLPVYEKLGDVREKAVTERKIADILIARGQLDEGLKVLQERCIPPMEKIGAIRDVAVFQGIVADILQARGQLDDALNIREHHELPVYEKLGDVREKAVTMGKIADILQARGQLDEALNIRQTEELPVYEKLGDVRSKAVTMGQIADILQ